MFLEADPPPYVHLSTPNRSLGAEARLWALGAICATTLGVAAGATAIGAWPVMPFAGLEVALLAFAFRVLGRHDADFERLEIGGHEVRVEAREAQSVTRFVAHRAVGKNVVGRGAARTGGKTPRPDCGHRKLETCTTKVWPHF